VPQIVLGIAFQILAWVASEIMFRGLFEIVSGAVHEAIFHVLL
jgi:hypothetical protein